MGQVSEQEIQDFLTKIESYLDDIPSSERQSGLLEFKNKLQSYQDAHPQFNFLQLKMSLGGPQLVANQIRLNQNQPLRTIKSQNVNRFALIFFALSFFTFTALMGVVWWKLTPFYSSTEEKIVVLGGLIEIDRQLGQAKIGDSFDFGATTYKNIFEGTFEVPATTTEDVTLEFDKAQLELTFTQDSRISWNCKVSDEPSDSFIKQEKELVTISLVGVGGSDCVFKLPSRLKYIVTGDSGKLDVIAPPNDLLVQLTNGIVAIAPDSELSYHFDLAVTSGFIDSNLKSLSVDDGIEIKVELANGSIQRKNL